MKTACTGVILAGGLNTRFSGQNKALIEIGGKRILDHLLEVFGGLFDDILLVTNHPLLYLDWNVEMVSDLFAVRSSLTGIHTGLFYARTPYVFFTACDTPFLKQAVVKAVVDRIAPQVDVVMPRTAAGMEPLCAVYAKTCLKPVERSLRQQKFKIQRVFKQHRIRSVSERVLRQIDPELMSFFNINRPEDLEQAESLLAAGSKRDRTDF